MLLHRGPSDGEGAQDFPGRDGPGADLAPVPVFPSLVTRAGPAWGVPISLAVHGAVVLALLLVPVLRPAPLPEQRDYVHALLYDPPPPPPPPLPKGSGLQTEPARPKIRLEPRRTALAAPAEAPEQPAPPGPDANAADPEPFGSPTGSDSGDPEGMEGGVEGGVVGGVPGGVLGGVVGGTGDIPVPVVDYDRPPRLIRQVKPRYPQEAFVKRVEGVVVVEILIDATGRVANARVIRSEPLLDQAALEAVRGWAFEPALKKGRAVATVAVAPVSFRIY